MGGFGNVLLINGTTASSGTAALGDVRDQPRRAGAVGGQVDQCPAVVDMAADLRRPERAGRAAPSISCQRPSRRPLRRRPNVPVRHEGAAETRPWLARAPVIADLSAGRASVPDWIGAWSSRRPGGNLSA
jgi:hypothetical protein